MDKNHYMTNMQKVLHMAGVLHTRGYEKLHVIPSLSPSGLSWRCNFMTLDTEPIIVSNWIFHQFDVNAISEIDIFELVNRYEREHFNFLRTCIGSDSRYVDWYRRMLDSLEDEELPYAISDYFSPCDHWQTSRGKSILTLPDEGRFLDIFLNGKKAPVATEKTLFVNRYIEPETLPVSNYDYASAINALNFAKIWVPKEIILIVRSEQYLAMLKGYQLHWDMRFGLLYDQNNDYFYVYRSGYIVGKYKLELDEDRYLCFEAYENPYIPDFMIIYECVKEACRQNGVYFDPEYFSDHAEETLRENSRKEQSHIPDLGPQSSSDNSFTAKARKLQSLWRVQNGLEIGIGPEKSSVDRNGQPTYYGNMIKNGESTGRNFFYPETFAYAKWRVHTKLKDETINDYRLFNNLMSSMPLAFNLFHPLMMLHTQNPAAIDKMIQNAFPNLPIYKIKEIGLEFIPTPKEKYTNDKSAMDAFISFYDKDGGEHIIAIETKYTDSLGTNIAKDDTLKIQFAIESGLFTEEGISHIKTNCTQIYRNFLLTEKFRVVNGLKDSYSIILAPVENTSSNKEVLSFKKFLKPEYKKLKINEYALEVFIQVLKANCPVEYLDWLEWFEDRYLKFDKLEFHIIQ
jgi:hypothetical protein